MKKIQHIFACLLLLIMSASCTQDMELNGKGYLKLNIKSVVSTHKPEATRADAPDYYNAKQLYVEIVKANGTVVMSTSDFYNDNSFKGAIKLDPGTYTINAHSYGWDGNGAGFNTPFYAGSTTVAVEEYTSKTASITCTQANVKVTVNYDDSFKKFFAQATTTVQSAISGITPLAFTMGTTTASGYFPVGNLTANLSVTNKDGKTFTNTKEFTGVKAREHYILNYKVKQEGHLGNGTTGGVDVEIDGSTTTYTYDIFIPMKSEITLEANDANVWSNFAMLSGTATGDKKKLKKEGITLQWRKSGDEVWTEVANSNLTFEDANDEIKVGYTLKGLNPNTKYEYKLRYASGDDETASKTTSFTTEQQVTLYNGGFENWWMDGKVAYANAQGTSFWDTSNQGAASFGGSNTTETTSVVHGGSKAAKLESKFIVIKFAAASLYTGSFGALIGTKGAWLNWGVPFTARPTALKGYMQYAPASINKVGSNLPAGTPGKGSPDQCGMYCALLSEALVVDNTDMSTFPNWETDSRVIAYGTLPTSQNVHSNGQWKEVNIPLVYRDLTRKPTHLLVVFSASKYGDYFHGGEGSTLYLDDFELVYGDSPTVK